MFFNIFKTIFLLIFTRQVICGGEVDVENRYVSPTLLTEVDLESKLMKDEIFGPLLPIIPIKNMKKAIDFVNDR